MPSGQTNGMYDGLISRRRLLRTAAGLGSLAIVPAQAWAQSMVRLPLPGGPDERSLTTAFPQKGAMILQRTRPPLLENSVGGL